MVRHYKRKPGSRRYLDYSSDAMDMALTAVRDEHISINKASKQFGIAKGTLVNRCQNKHGLSVGKPTVLGRDEEDALVENIVTCAEWGFPVSRSDLQYLVKSYLDTNGISVPQFSLNLPGEGWLSTFLHRHRNVLANRTVNNIKRSRAAVSKASLEEYHQNLTASISGIPASNIFNYDETNLADNTSATKLLFRRGVKYPDRVINFTKSCVTIMVCAAADGTLLPPFVVYKSDGLYPQWTRHGPQGPPCCNEPCCAAGTQFHNTSSGWFDMPTFEKWFSESFVPHAKRLPGCKAIIGDNLSSHFSVKVLQEAKDNNIKFLCLPPNSTHLAQPLDVAFFAPLKSAWKKVITSFKTKYPGKSIVDKKIFPSMLREVLTLPTFTPHISTNIISGFKATGIFPLNITPLLQRLAGNKSDALLHSPRTTLPTCTATPTTATTNTIAGNVADTVATFLQEQRFPSQSGSGIVPGRGRGKRIAAGRCITTSTFDSSDTDDDNVPVLPNVSQRGGRNTGKTSRKRLTSESSSTSTDLSEAASPSPAKKVAGSTRHIKKNGYVIVKVGYKQKTGFKKFLANVLDVEELDVKVQFYKSITESNVTFTKVVDDDSWVSVEDILEVVREVPELNTREQLVFKKGILL